MEQPVEVAGDAGLRQHVAHVDEHRQGHERVPAHRVEAGGERDLEAALAPKGERRGGGDEADGAEHPLPGQQGQQHRGEHEQGDELWGHVSSSPRAFARSLKKMAMVCSSIIRMPMHIMILIGASGGAQEE